MNAVVHALYGHGRPVREAHVIAARSVLMSSEPADALAVRYACDVLMAFGDAGDVLLGSEVRKTPIARVTEPARNLMTDLILICLGFFMATLLMLALVNIPSVLRVISTTSLLELPPASVGGSFPEGF